MWCKTHRVHHVHHVHQADVRKGVGEIVRLPCDEQGAGSLPHRLHSRPTTITPLGSRGKDTSSGHASLGARARSAPAGGRKAER